MIKDKGSVKIVLIGILFVSTMFSFFNSVAFSYGLDIYTAETKTPGIYSETLLSAHNEAYYRVNCSAGQLLTASINFSGVFDLNLYLYVLDPAVDLIDSSETTGTSDVVEYQSTKTGDYYIKVSRFEGVGDVNFTLVITLQQKFQIPAFELPYIALSILIIIGLLILKKDPKFW
ncbi:MAG: PPC domain-containing protein [Candidatus Helarchaeota archaeon]|nr:PPC domain-containing protein [Candidatus Helarchaeota archaeon]